LDVHHPTDVIVRQRLSASRAGFVAASFSSLLSLCLTLSRSVYESISDCMSGSRSVLTSCTVVSAEAQQRYWLHDAWPCKHSVVLCSRRSQLSAVKARSHLNSQLNRSVQFISVQMKLTRGLAVASIARDVGSSSTHRSSDIMH